MDNKIAEIIVDMPSSMTNEDVRKARTLIGSFDLNMAKKLQVVSAALCGLLDKVETVDELEDVLKNMCIADSRRLPGKARAMWWYSMHVLMEYPIKVIAKNIGVEVTTVNASVSKFRRQLDDDLVVKEKFSKLKDITQYERRVSNK